MDISAIQDPVSGHERSFSVCLKLNLLFELTEVSEKSFRFRLLSPSWLQVWGAFTVQELDIDAVSLHLKIGSATRLGGIWLRFYPVSAAIRHQITREVAHVKASIEASI